jgi:hypothetical protein
MKRRLSGIESTERENGPQKNLKRRRTPFLGLLEEQEELQLDEHFPWHRIRRLQRK